MSNGELIEVGAYDRIADPLAFIKQMGRSIALSKMFGIDTEAQGEILALEVLARRCPILKLAERYHFIFGRLSMKAEAMLADFRAKLGGDYDIIEQSSEAAEISLSLNGKKRNFRLTWEEAQKEPFAYEPKEKDVLAAWAANKKVALKAKYQTPRARMQMLWARTVSHGVRTMAPEVTSGAYTPEEIEDFDELQPATNGNGAKGSRSKPAAQQTTVESVTVTLAATTTEPVATVPTTTAAPTPAAEVEYCTGKQAARITELLGVLQPSVDDIEAMKKRRGINAWRQLTVAGADDLIAKLQQAVDQRKPPATAMAEAATVSPSPATSVRNNDPATEPQVARIRQLGSEIEQSQPGFTARLAAKLRESGLVKLVDLTVSEADSLIQQLTIKNLDAFFAASLEGHAKFRPTKQAEGTPSDQPTASAAA